MKIAIGLPTNRLIKQKTAQSLMELVANTKHDLEIIVSTRGYNTAENRNYIAAQAVKKGCDYLMMVDDDMIYEPDTIEKLLATGKDIVGGLYKTKYEVQDYVMEGELKDELFECKAVGTGLLLVKCDVFKKVSEPWFGYQWQGGMVIESVDWFFCRKAREAGLKVWCEPKVTAKHISQKEY